MTNPNPDVLCAWLGAVTEKDHEKVVSCYEPDAILLGTVSPTVRQGHEAIGDYFEHFLDQESVAVEVTEQINREAGELLVSSGLYTFRIKKGEETRTIPARFTFVFRKTDDDWKIVEHHSSRAP